MVLEKLAHSAPMLPGDCGSIWLMSGLCSITREGEHKPQEEGGSLSQKERRRPSDGTRPGSAASACLVQDRAAVCHVVCMLCD